MTLTRHEPPIMVEAGTILRHAGGITGISPIANVDDAATYVL